MPYLPRQNDLIMFEGGNSQAFFRYKMVVDKNARQPIDYVLADCLFRMVQRTKKTVSDR